MANVHRSPSKLRPGGPKTYPCLMKIKRSSLRGFQISEARQPGDSACDRHINSKPSELPYLNSYMIIAIKLNVLLYEKWAANKTKMSRKCSQQLVECDSQQLILVWSGTACTVMVFNLDTNSNFFQVLLKAFSNITWD